MRLHLPPNIIQAPDWIRAREWSTPLPRSWFLEIERFFDDNRALALNPNPFRYIEAENEFIKQEVEDMLRTRGESGNTAIDLNSDHALYKKWIKDVLFHLKLGFVLDPVITTNSEPTKLVLYMLLSNNIKARTISKRGGVWKPMSIAQSARARDVVLDPFNFICVQVRRDDRKKDSYYYTPKFMFELKSLREVELYQQKYNFAGQYVGNNFEPHATGFSDNEEYAVAEVLNQRK